MSGDCFLSQMITSLLNSVTLCSHIDPNRLRNYSNNGLLVSVVEIISQEIYELDSERVA